MGTLLELVFPDQSAGRAAGLLADALGAAGGTVCIEVDGVTQARETDPSRVVALLEARAVINIERFKLPHVGAVPDLAVYLLRSGGAVDVEMTVDLSDVADRKRLALGLYEFAASMADRYAVESYFAGLVRAWDEDLRIFTGRTWGPIRL